jgi:putative Holliday junction resolvase
MSIENNSAKISYFLGIDYGKSKVGLALADSETKIAFACKILENDRKLKESIAKVIEKENVSKAVMGIPRYENGETIEKEARQLGEFLRNNLKIEVFYHNEMFTSKMAQANLKEAGFKNVSKFDDKESARLILQEWLDNN